MSPTILARIYEEEFKKDMLSLKVCEDTFVLCLEISFRMLNYINMY